MPAFEWATDCDPLNAATPWAIMAGVSTRRYRNTLDPLPQSEAQRSVSRSAVSWRFVALSTEQLSRWFAGPIKVVMLGVLIDGVHFRDLVVLLAFGFDAADKTHVMGFREGSTKNARVVRSLLSELIDRSLQADSPGLWVIDGAKALRRAFLETFGVYALAQRCQAHKRRNVLEQLPKELHASVSRAITDTWDTKDSIVPKPQFDRLVRSVARSHRGATSSLPEGLEETLTHTALGVDEALYSTLRSTKSIENLDERIAHYTRNVKCWRDGQMALRWIGSGLREARRGFRVVRGSRDMNDLATELANGVPSVSDAKAKIA